MPAPDVRIGVVDIGSNSTRLLVADVDDGGVTELDRRSQVTRLAEGVDAGGRLSDEGMARVAEALAGYREAIDAAGCETTTAVLTSAVRDAANGDAFVARVRDEFGLDARVIGDDEVLVIDIGGGSTELVVGVPGGEPAFHVSTQAGVVRQTERHLHHDPPEHHELEALSAEIVAILDESVPRSVRSEAAASIAVAGTATSLAAILQELEPYDSERVHGYVLPLSQLELELARLAQMTVEARRAVKGLHPDRAPTIVAGVAILIDVLREFGLETVEVSEHDILRGAALTAARG